VPVSFMPTASVYANERCGGVNIVLTARDSLDAPELGLEIASALSFLYPQEFKIASIDGLMRNKASLEALEKGTDPRRIAEDWQDANNVFAKTRKKYLVY